MAEFPPTRASLLVRLRDPRDQAAWAAGAAAEGEQAGPEAGAPPVPFPCPGCGQRLKVKPGLAGKKVKCPQRGLLVIVPETRAGDSARPSLQPVASPSLLLPVSTGARPSSPSPAALIIPSPSLRS